MPVSPSAGGGEGGGGGGQGYESGDTVVEHSEDSKRCSSDSIFLIRREAAFSPSSHYAYSNSKL